MSARGLNVSRATIYRYESAYIEKLPLDVLEPLSKVLKCTPQYLMGWDTIASFPSPAAGPDLSDDEAELLKQYRLLGDEGQAMLLSRAEELIKLGYTRIEEAKKDVKASD